MALPPCWRCRCERREGEGGSFFFVSERGSVKRVNVLDVQANTATDFTVFNVEEGDRLGWALHTKGKEEVILISAEGQSIRFGEDEVRVMGLAAGGVGGMKLRGKDRLVHAAVIDAEGDLVTISAAGYAKRTSLAEYSSQGRNGGGILAHKLVERTGKLTAGLALPPRMEHSQVILVSGKGVAKPLLVSDIPRMGRSASGKQVLTLAERDTVVSIWPIGGQGHESGPDGVGNGDEGGDAAAAGAVTAPAAAPRKVAPKQSVPAEQVELLAEAAAPTSQERGGKTPASAAPLPIKQVAGGARRQAATAVESPTPPPAPPLDSKIEPAGKIRHEVKPEVRAPAKAESKTEPKTEPKMGPEVVRKTRPDSSAAAQALAAEPAQTKSGVKSEAADPPARKGKPSNRPTPGEIARGTRGSTAGAKEPVTPRFDFGEEEQAEPKNASGKSQAKKLDVVVSVTKTQAQQSAGKTKPAPKKDK